MRALRHRDFLLLWLGAFLSFIGSWIQGVAQGWLVFDLTHDESKLTFVAFCSMVPVSVFGPFAGALTDTLDKRRLLNFLQFLLACCALTVAASIRYNFVSYGLITAAALVVGTVSCVEMPTRQSIVGLVVPKDELKEAIPINAMTFNIARLFGPAVGGWLLARYGPEPCYVINGLSFFALIIGVQMIKTDLSPKVRQAQPIRDLLMEGMLYTFKDVRLRTMFFLESLTSAFGLAYLALMPAVASKILHLDKQGLGHCYTAVGVGALIALLLVLKLSHLPGKGKFIQAAMLIMGVSLLILSQTHEPLVAYGLFILLGLASIMQFNVTNTLFQTLAPESLRGRILSMHVWALSGLGPFGTLGLGFVARNVSISASLLVGGIVLLIGASYSLVSRSWREGI